MQNRGDNQQIPPIVWLIITSMTHQLSQVASVVFSTVVLLWLVLFLGRLELKVLH